MIKCYQPTLDELWFRESLMADPDTMSYNDAWGGTSFSTNPRTRYYRASLNPEHS